MKPLSIVVITYNRPDDVLLLLQKIGAQRDAVRLLESVIIIDNASTASYAPVQDYINTNQALPFRYVHSDENLGVARGRNKGIALAEAPIVITIDDDAYFRDEDALLQIEQLFSSAYARENKVGVFCFKVLYGSTGELQQTAFPHKKMEKYRDKDHFLTSYFIGCGHAILKKVYNEAGIYPVDFFYGMEEYDLGYRILNLGYTMAYDHSVVIIHNESPLGRTPHAEKMRMLWVNKSKVAYRYLPLIYYVTTTCMWSLQFLKKTSFNLKLWFRSWGDIIAIPGREKRTPINAKALQYVKKVEGRMWF